MPSFSGVRVRRKGSISNTSECTARNCVQWEWVSGAVSAAKLKATCFLQDMKLGLPYLTHHNSEPLVNLGTEIKHSADFSCASAVQSPPLLPMWK